VSLLFEKLFSERLKIILFQPGKIKELLQICLYIKKMKANSASSTPVRKTRSSMTHSDKNGSKNNSPSGTPSGTPKVAKQVRIRSPSEDERNESRDEGHSAVRNSSPSLTRSPKRSRRSDSGETTAEDNDEKIVEFLKRMCNGEDVKSIEKSMINPPNRTRQDDLRSAMYWVGHELTEQTQLKLIDKLLTEAQQVLQIQMEQLISAKEDLIYLHRHDLDTIYSGEGTGYVRKYTICFPGATQLSVTKNTLEVTAGENETLIVIPEENEPADDATVDGNDEEDEE
jgi:hypothetical protein